MLKAGSSPKGVARKVLQSCVGAILGNCQYWAGVGTEAALQDLLDLIIRPLDSLVLAVGTCLLYHPSG